MTCQTCQYSAKDAAGSLRCLKEGMTYGNIVAPDERCGGYKERKNEKKKKNRP